MELMTCDFVFCIYNENNKCIKKKIKISSLCVCEDCIIPEISKEIIDKNKKRLLLKLEKMN